MTQQDENAPFWKTKSLARMSEAEWESLCDGCGQCCMVKLQDVDTDEYLQTRVACRLFDARRCRCTDYANRLERVADCINLTAENVHDIPWLPKTCAYRLIARGEGLFDWHPLVSGRRESVREAGIAVRGAILSEDDVPDGDLPDYVIT